MKFCTIVQNFGDELGRLSCEATTIPRRVFVSADVSTCVIARDQLITDRKFTFAEAENLKSIQIRENA